MTRDIITYRRKIRRKIGCFLIHGISDAVIQDTFEVLLLSELGTEREGQIAHTLKWPCDISALPRPIPDKQGSEPPSLGVLPSYLPIHYFSSNSVFLVEGQDVKRSYNSQLLFGIGNLIVKTQKLACLVFSAFWGFIPFPKQRH